MSPEKQEGGWIEGALRKKGRTAGYYNIIAGSYGLQAGVESFDYVLFFMNNEALSYLDRSEGFEIGMGPNIVVLDTGKATQLTSTNLRDDVYVDGGDRAAGLEDHQDQSVS